jgi:hypothetical protein
MSCWRDKQHITRRGRRQEEFRNSYRVRTASPPVGLCNHAAKVAPWFLPGAPRSVPFLRAPNSANDLLLGVSFSRHSSSPRFRSEDHPAAGLNLPAVSFSGFGSPASAPIPDCLNRGVHPKTVPNFVPTLCVAGLRRVAIVEGAGACK